MNSSEPFWNYHKKAVQADLALGLPILPLSTGTKVPIGGFNVKAFLKEAQKISREEIEKILSEHLNHAVLEGLPYGSKARRLYIEDFEQWHDLVAVYPDWRDLSRITRVVRTCHGGGQIYRSSNKVIHRQIKIFGLEHQIDLLGTGGYAVGAGSVINHTFCPEKDKRSGKCTFTNELTTYEVLGTWDVAFSEDPLLELTQRGRKLGWHEREFSQSGGGDSGGANTDKQFEIFLARDPLASAFFYGDFTVAGEPEKPSCYTCKSRSEAELSLVIAMIRYGFSDDEIHSRMLVSKTGKWAESRNGYRKLTLRKAHEFVTELNLKIGVGKSIPEYYGRFVRQHKPKVNEKLSLRHNYKILAGVPDRLRPQQIALLQKLDPMPRKVIIKSPTGIGKTWVIVIKAKMIGPTVIIVPDRALQTQYREKYGVPCLMGRHNYLCMKYNKPADLSPCALIEEERQQCIPGCPWDSALHIAEQTLSEGGAVCLNFGNFTRFEKKHRLIVFDESQKVITQLAESVPLHNEDPSVIQSLWLDKEECQRAVQELTEKLKALNTSDREYDHTALQIQKWSNKMQKLDFFLMAENQHEKSVFVFSRIVKGKYERLAKIDEAAAARALFSLPTEYITMVSATPTRVEGIPVVEVAEGVATRENAPIVYSPIGKMTSRELQKSNETLADAGKFICDTLATMKSDGRTVKCIVHTANTTTHMDIAKYLKPYSVIVHEKGKIDETLHEFRKGDHDILLIASADSGHDFSGADFGLQFSIKLPYPRLDEEWEGRRKTYGEEKFQSDYNEATARTLIQMTGRICRGENDYGYTFILDSKFEEFYNRHQELFPRDFHKRLIDLSARLKIPELP